MVDIVADLHLHSKYSRAVSNQMILPLMAQVGEQKGIDVLATGDWTHPMWFREMRSQLEESEEGLYKIKDKGEGVQGSEKKEMRFLLSVEISSIYSQGGKGRRIHNLVFVPNLETAEKVNKELTKRGCNLSSDGRPIIGLSSKNLLSLLLEIDERSLLIPAHIWTPWFGIYGQLSGFNSLDEAFEELAPYVYGIETGLSSDPEMNWQIRELDTRSILSFSDAHSLAKMGREATVFRLESLSYEHIRQAILAPSKGHNAEVMEKIAENDEHSPRNKVLYTIEFYPEEGKYHYSGHRNCDVFQTPDEQRAANSICPHCKRKVTDGVMRRVQELAQEDPRGIHKANGHNVVWITDPKGNHPSFVKIVPLNEIIAEAIGSPVTSPKVKRIFDTLCQKGISEFHVLLKLSIQDIETMALPVTSVEGAKKIAEGIGKVRSESIVIQPGYDGVYGVVKIWQESKKVGQEASSTTGVQESLEL